MKRVRIAILVTILVMLAVEAPEQSDDSYDRQQEFELTSDVFDNMRPIRVLLPSSYFDLNHAERCYPVFYFTDGWDAWHGWGLPEVAEQLWDEGTIPEVIFIGINGGGRTRETKDPDVEWGKEYLPYRDPFWPDERPDPSGNLFPEFLFDEVMPAVNERFRTKAGADSTGLAGSSYGGIAALHTAPVRRLSNDRLRLVIAEGGTHWYDSWKERLPMALTFLLAGTE